MARDTRLRTISVNLPVAIVDRLRVLGFYEHFSSSAIVEAALAEFIDDRTDAELAIRLRASGASLRRPLAP
jgi:predicted transcriptional regulator